ncbi:MAG: alpha/beta hydrolase [Candidatus Melainabacteria bacterium]|nr:alpha/beta hydrolase [Candidatus Melainabacteria bacterium]
MKSILLSLVLLFSSLILPVNAHVQVAKSIKEKAILVCIPGLTESPFTFKKFADDMAHYGVSTYGVNVQGYEICEPGKKQEKVDFNKTVSRVMETARMLREKHPGVPVFLLGESTGGAIALRAAALNTALFDGLICTVPTWQVRSTIKIGSLEVLDLTVCRKRQRGMAVNLVIKRATDKQDLRDALMAVESRRQRFSIVETAKFVRFMNAGPKTASQVKDLPVLFVDGLKDKVSKPTGCAFLFNKIASQKKTYILDAEAGHLICEEGQYSRPLLLGIRNWINKAITKDFATSPEAHLISSDSVKLADSIQIKKTFECAGVSPNAIVAKRYAGQISSAN